MLADQVVHPVPIRRRLGQQVLVIQRLQTATGRREVRAVQCGGGVAVDLRTRVQTQPPEQPLQVRAQIRVRQVERRGDRQILRGHQLEPTRRRRQLSRPPGRGPCRVVPQLAGHHPDRQRQVPAQPGDLGHLRITRTQPGPDGAASALVQRILVKGLIDAADPALNIVLTGGEEVRVPESGKIYVIGNVKTPGAFPVGDGTESTVLKMLAMSQGLTSYAAKEAYIYRREGNGNKNEIPIPLKLIMERKAPDTPLLANDILYVPENKSSRMTWGALEKVLLIGGMMGAAAIYAFR